MFQNFQFHFHCQVINKNILVKAQKPQLCYCPDDLMVKLSIFQAVSKLMCTLLCMCNKANSEISTALVPIHKCMGQSKYVDCKTYTAFPTQDVKHFHLRRRSKRNQRIKHTGKRQSKDQDRIQAKHTIKIENFIPPCIDWYHIELQRISLFIQTIASLKPSPFHARVRGLGTLHRVHVTSMSLQLNFQRKLDCKRIVSVHLACTTRGSLALPNVPNVEHYDS